jgi:hypothetical protein
LVITNGRVWPARSPHATFLPISIEPRGQNRRCLIHRAEIAAIPAVDFDRALQIVLAAPIEDLEWIVKRHFSRSALRRIPLARRDDAIRWLGA